ncbi:hypothetical protein [Achromobacter xylosoxidans]|uniref:hypothetical protein n=1 Tax=Alcaligenes xylosoxydans xylosoxydans TaxID=85698 RepID=UPI0015654E16|nr:hypothetical protein [Achromobacter xylosoxidans]QKI75529.1 hypothetical protein HPS43_09105 [Achromobacter xylosoxidans]
MLPKKPDGSGRAADSMFSSSVHQSQPIIERSARNNRGISNSSWGALQLYTLGMLGLAAIAALLAPKPIDTAATAKALGTGLLLIGYYAFLLSCVRRHAPVAIICVVTLVALPFVPYLRFMLYAVGGWGFGTLWRQKRSFDGWGCLALPPVYLIALAHVFMGFEYSTSLTLGLINRDSLFHTAISGMYQLYGVASVGLDGLVPISYHTLSHKLLAGLGIVSGLDALASYAQFYFLLGPLLLVFSLAGLAKQFRPDMPFSQALIAISLLCLLLAATPAFSAAAFWPSFVESESFLVALVLLSASLAALMQWLQDGRSSTSSLLYALVLLLLASASKVSVGAVGFCAYLLLGLWHARTWRYWLLLLASLGLLYLLQLNASIARAHEISAFVPFDFIDRYTSPLTAGETGPMSVQLFLTLHFLPVWLTLLTGFACRKAYWKSVDIVLLAGMLAPGLFLTLTWSLVGGSVYYFSAVCSMIALSLFVRALPDRLFPFRGQGRVWVAILSIGAICAAALCMEHTIRNTRGIAAVQSQPEKLVDLSTIVKQLHAVCDGTPRKTILVIDNPQVLVSKIGCHAYWFFPAVAQRPILDGLPDLKLCPNLETLYGLADYYRRGPVPQDRRVPQGFVIKHIQLTE